MAIRFESTCDDNVKWHARALYPEPGRDDPAPLASSPLDLSFNNELSDQDERRTNSCSPNSSDETNGERLTLAASPANFASTLSFGSNTGRDLVRKRRSFTPGWQMQTGAFDGGIYRTSVVRSKAAMNGTKKQDWNESNLSPSPNLFVRSKFSPERFSQTNKVHGDETETKARDIVGLKQNGGAPASANAAEKPYQQLFSVGGLKNSDFEDKKSAVTSAVRDVQQVDNKNNSEETPLLLGTSEGFGETDAAEALLGLSEGFYHSTNSPASSRASAGYKKQLLTKSCDALTDSSESNKGENKSSSEIEATIDTFSNSTSMTIASTDIGNGVRESKFHYKKRIFQKYVNSQVEPPHLQHFIQSEAPMSTNNLHSNPDKVHDCFESNISSAACSDKGTFAANTQKPNFNSFSCNKLYATSFAETNEAVTAKTNLKSAKSFCAEFNHCRENAIKSINLNALQSSVENGKSFCARSLGKSIADSEKTNLYRISTSLGSSNESLSATVEDENEDLVSDSGTSESSASESDDECDNPSLLTHLPAIKNTKVSSVDVTKRKVVLNKPKFSPSTWMNANKVTEVNETFANRRKPFNNDTIKPKDLKLLPGSSSTAQAAFENTAASMSEPSKQNEIHIKKATFTFNSMKKVDPAVQQNGLSLTSRASHTGTMADRAQSIVKDKNSLHLQREAESIETTVPRFSASLKNSGSDRNLTFGRFRNGDSFETLSNPSGPEKPDSTVSKKSPQTSTSKHEFINVEVVPYDKDRLPRPSARSAALEAQQLHKSSTERKRKLSSLRNNGKQKSKQPGKPSIKRLKHDSDEKNPKLRLNANSKAIVHMPTSNKTANEPKQNGGSIVEITPSCAKLPPERSSSRRKPSRVFKHQKYTSVSMMSSNHSPRDSSASSEFAIISKPLNLDHRVLLANSIDLCRGSPNNVDSSTSSSMTSSSSCSSRTSSVAGDDNEVEVGKKIDVSLPERNRCKRHRHLSAIETNLKSELMKQKHKMKRLLSETGSRGCCSSLIANNWRRSPPQSTNGPMFQLLSLFPAPASIKAGFAQGELLPGYGPSVSGRRSSLPLRWSKGRDVRDLKQKRQREKWRKMTLDMFCMGATS